MVRSLLGLLLSCALSLGASAEELSAATTVEVAPETRLDTTGFYPIWENTGHVEKPGDVRVGTTGAQVGLGRIGHVGVQPINFIYRSPNAYLKVALAESARWNLAAQVGVFRLLAGASRAFFSPMYASRLDNSDFALTLVPLSFCVSGGIGQWMELHQTLTGLVLLTSGPLRNRVTPGYSAVAELNPHGRHGLSLHAGETGFWAHDLAIVGASYRYRNTWMEFRLGYFYRFTKTGSQAAPLASFGLLL
jgi:hypothetical protein